MDSPIPSESRTRLLLEVISAQLRAVGPLYTAFLRDNEIDLNELPTVLAAAADLIRGALCLPKPTQAALQKLAKYPFGPSQEALRLFWETNPALSH
jgi:hypothetical protein